MIDVLVADDDPTAVLLFRAALAGGDALCTDLGRAFVGPAGVFLAATTGGGAVCPRTPEDIFRQKIRASV